MKCHYCGEEVAENQSYCMWCGTRQEPAEQRAEKENRSPEPIPDQHPVELNPEVKPEPVRPMGKYLPRLQLPTARGLGKMILFGILTLGIYPTVIWSRLVTELNIAASRHDGRRTVPFFGMLMLAPVTLGIYGFVWMHKLCDRIGEELKRRGIGYGFSPADFWLWNVLGSLILVGPFVFTHRLMKAMNAINAHFNTNG